MYQQSYQHYVDNFVDNLLKNVYLFLLNYKISEIANKNNVDKKYQKFKNVDNLYTIITEKNDSVNNKSFIKKLLLSFFK